MGEPIVIRPRKRKVPAGLSPYRFFGWTLADALRHSQLIYCRDSGLEVYKPPRRTCLYVMTAGDFIKVGITNDPIKRLYDLQIANPLVVELQKAYLPPEDIQALRIEMIAHRALQEFHVRGEWFAIEGLRLFTEAGHD